MGYTLGTVVLETFTNLRTVSMAIISKWLQILPSIDEINFYGMAIIGVSGLALIGYYLVLIPISRYAPERVHVSYQVVFARLVWSVFTLFQVYPVNKYYFQS